MASEPWIESALERADRIISQLRIKVGEPWTDEQIAEFKRQWHELEVQTDPHSARREQAADETTVTEVYFVEDILLRDGTRLGLSKAGAELEISVGNDDTEALSWTVCLNLIADEVDRLMGYLAGWAAGG